MTRGTQTGALYQPRGRKGRGMGGRFKGRGHMYQSVQVSRSELSDSATPWTAAHQASLSITNSRTLLKLMPIQSVMPSNHLILCHPLHLLPSIFPSIRVFSKEPVLWIRWPEYWSFSFSICPSNAYSGLISFRIDLCILVADSCWCLAETNKIL